jgi:carboxymethylenebutenolidase
MKILRRILLGLLAVIVVLAIVLAIAIVVDGFQAASRLDSVTNTRIANPSGPEIRAFVARPSTPGPHPAVIMIHEFWGLNQSITGKAEALAQAGYLVIAPDLFRGSSAAWVPRAIFQVVATPQDQILSDLDAVFTWLAAQPDVQPDRIAVMGFCFGGGASLRYSLHNNQLAGTVVLYGMPVADPAQLRSLPGPVLGIFGSADQSIPVSQVQAFEAALNEAGVANQITIYEGQPHAFVGTIEEIRQGGPPAQAWEEVLKFLDQTLAAPNSARHTPDPARAISGTPWRYWLGLAFEHAFGSAVHHH